MRAWSKTVPAVVARRKSSSPCGARTRTGAPCRRTGLGNGRCANHGGMSSGPKTPVGRARIAEVQRKRWAAWRAQFQEDQLT
ncbi:MAG: HGGxSTG domain-containing protein [Hyphomicrobiaceae bacterium]